MNSLCKSYANEQSVFRDNDLLDREWAMYKVEMQHKEEYKILWCVWVIEFIEMNCNVINKKIEGDTMYDCHNLLHSELTNEIHAVASYKHSQSQISNLRKKYDNQKYVKNDLFGFKK